MAASALRIKQIKLVCAALVALGNRPAGARLIARLRRLPGLGAALGWLVGYRRLFPSLAAAEACARQFSALGHEHPDVTAYHAEVAGEASESDYAALFHLRPYAPELRQVFDLGGSVGNLFYVFDRYLHLRPDMVWQVNDLPASRAPCLALAAARGETRMRFEDDVAAASGADLFIVCGALHYFAEPLDAILRRIGTLPAHVLVNRVPCAPDADRFTIQDAGSHMVACKLVGRAALIDGMAALGYTLRDTWPAFERRVAVPLDPGCCEPVFAGFYFTRDDRSGI